ncbi:hypothetical protein A3Q56_00302 [Intoshia linei]|uniref:Uncharacterized protein n=1 Tax=Intoshia linei TaxID=1819745 RepID=A0A177BE07_9BILA|nr:hypothetical protein A3Q56_00302 [Intoshia linei]
MKSGTNFLAFSISLGPDLLYTSYTSDNVYIFYYLQLRVNDTRDNHKDTHPVDIITYMDDASHLQNEKLSFIKNVTCCSKFMFSADLEDALIMINQVKNVNFDYDNQSGSCYDVKFVLVRYWSFSDKSNTINEKKILQSSKAMTIRKNESKNGIEVLVVKDHPSTTPNHFDEIKCNDFFEIEIMHKEKSIGTINFPVVISY